MSDPITRAAESLWVSGPLRLQRRFFSTRGIVGDWHGIALSPPLAILALILTVAGYLMVGALGMDYDRVYSESLPIMASLIALGALSGQLGLLGLTSFALGDFFIGNPGWSDTGLDSAVLSRLSLIVAYLILAVAVLLIPRLSKTLVLAIGRWRRIPMVASWLIATPVVIIVSWLGLTVWAQMAPTLIRPYFTWAGDVPTVEAVQVLQGETAILVGVGVAAMVVRQVVLGLFIYSPELTNALDDLEARAHQKVLADGREIVPPAPTAARRFLTDLMSAALATLVLAGILESVFMWVLVFMVFVTVRMLRSDVIRLDPLERWKRIVARVPVVARLGVMVLGALLLGTFVGQVVASYTAMAIVVAVGVVVAYLIFPGQPATDTPAETVREAS